MSVNIRPDKLIALLVLAISIATLFAAMRYPIFDKWETSPGMFPTVIAMLMLGLSIFQLVLPDTNAEKSEQADELNPLSRTLFTFFLIIVLYVASLPHIGFLSSTPIFMLLAVYVLGGSGKWYLLSATAVLITVITHLSFLKVFGIHLP